MRARAGACAVPRPVRGAGAGPGSIPPGCRCRRLARAPAPGAWPVPRRVRAPGARRPAPLAQGHEQRREEHVVVRLQLRERCHQLDTAQGMLVRRKDAHRLERGAHLRCQRTDVDFGGLHDGVLGGTRGRAAPGRKTLSYDDRFSGSVPGDYLPRINRGGRRWTLASGATGTAGESIRILGIDPPGHGVRHHRLVRRRGHVTSPAARSAPGARSFRRACGRSSRVCRR